MSHFEEQMKVCAKIGQLIDAGKLEAATMLFFYAAGLGVKPTLLETILRPTRFIKLREHLKSKQMYSPLRLVASEGQAVL